MIKKIERISLHTRKIDVQGFLREDGLWEVEGRLLDTKANPIDLVDRGRLQVGRPLHDMKLTLTVDNSLLIIDVKAEMNATPYKDCPGASEQYSKLVGIRIAPGWMSEVKKMIDRPVGCTHLTEMLPVLATGLMQTIIGYQIHIVDKDVDTLRDKKKLLNSCFGYRSGGRAERIYWVNSKD